MVGKENDQGDNTNNANIPPPPCPQRPPQPPTFGVYSPNTPTPPTPSEQSPSDPLSVHIYHSAKDPSVQPVKNHYGPIPPSESRGTNWARIFGIGCLGMVIVVLLMGACTVAMISRITNDVDVGSVSTTGYVNDILRDGSFDIQVLDVKDVGPVVEDQNTEVTANGTFYAAVLNVQNTSNESKEFWNSNMRLIDRDGKQFTVSALATDTFSSENDSMLTLELEPGSTKEVNVLFDVSQDTIADKLFISSDIFGDGVIVNLDLTDKINN